MKGLLRLAGLLPLALISPLIVLLTVTVLAVVDVVWALLGRRRQPADSRPSTESASVVIPNWNGRDLLEKYLPSVEAALSGNPRNELIVIDNGSSDGSAEFIRSNFPNVNLIALDRNLGFGGGSNEGVRAAKNDVVVLLNSDMRVERDFLGPLLEGFTDDKVFAVSCQIQFSDPSKRREETGLTQGWWEEGSLRVGHRIDDAIGDLFPCFYGGGGSCAFDRRKFLELGGFDALLHPFYLEDTDLGYMAWKRGWKVLYQPRSVVCHEHRGTIGKRFSELQIQAAIKKNFILFVWKNIHGWRKLASHFFFTYAGVLVSIVFGDSPRRTSMAGWLRAFVQLPGATRARWRAHSLACITDDEAFRRPLGGYFRDRFCIATAEPERLRVLFVSPYPICPPIHGGGVFMYGTVRELAARTQLHLIALVESPEQIEAHRPLADICASAEFRVRRASRRGASASISPHAAREFSDLELEWLIHRQIYLNRIDVVQLEYTALLQYAGKYRHVACMVFEHDVYFQSIARGLPYMDRRVRIKAGFEYLRALRFELQRLQDCDGIQLCTSENREYLGSFLPACQSRIHEGMRAGVDTSRYTFRRDGREPDTMLFLGSFRHTPNQVALEWFVKRALPKILEHRPRARLIVVGSELPPRHFFANAPGAVELLGFVEDIRDELARRAVFVCPILSGSGVRVKLLEAFASGIPVVSTRIGAEGLGRKDGELCALADEPLEFARKVIEILDCPAHAQGMAERAREEVVAHWDMAVLTERLVRNYCDVLSEKRKTTCRPNPV